MKGKWHGRWGFFIVSLCWQAWEAQRPGRGERKEDLNPKEKGSRGSGPMLILSPGVCQALSHLNFTTVLQSWLYYSALQVTNPKLRQVRRVTPKATQLWTWDSSSSSAVLDLDYTTVSPGQMYAYRYPGLILCQLIRSGHQELKQCCI